MDFIIDLPVISGYDSMFVMVDRFTKMAHFTSCAKTISGDEAADLFFENVVQLHGLLDDITFDRGPQFISHFLQRLLQTLCCTINFSSVYHPQTDGQTEGAHQILEQYLPSSPITTLCMCL
jgi:IS30 family transposase